MARRRDGAEILVAGGLPDHSQRLGYDSVAYHLADAHLRALWEKLKSDRAVALKRQLWADC